MKTVAFLARWPGYLVLESLLANPKIKLLAVYSHRFLPATVTVRPEAHLFESACRGVCPLTWDADDAPECDLLLALSWRKRIPGEVLARARHTVNIHRGELPKYAGAKPVERALEAREPRVAITAHRMTEEIDEGYPVAVVYSSIPQARHTYSVAEHAEVVKEHIYPLYVPLVNLAIHAVSLTKPKPLWEGGVCD